MTNPYSGRVSTSGLTVLRHRWQKRRKQSQAFWHMAGHFAPYLRKRGGMLTLALACSYGYMLMRMLEPWPIKLIFDSVLLHHPLPSFLAPFLPHGADDRLFLLNMLVVVVVFIASVEGVLYFYQQLLIARAGQQIVAAIRLDLYSHIQRLSLSFHARRRTGDLLIRLTNDIRTLREVLTSTPLDGLGQFFLTIGMVVVMFLMDWRLTLITLTALPCIALLLRTYQRPMKEAIRRQRKREGHLATLATEVLGAIKVVQGFGREQYEIERFGSHNQSGLRSGLRAARLEAKFRWAAEMAVAAVTAVLLSVAVRRIIAGALSPGDLLVFVSYLRSFNRPLRHISRTVERMARGTAAGERILEMLETTPTVQELPGAVAASRCRGAVLYEEVSFAYRQRTPVLSDITLRIEPGERVAIVGPTGSGKTSLVSLLPRFYDPTAGRVCIDGREVREFTLASLRQQISLVFQEPVLFAATIAENIAYGKPGATRGEVEKAAELAGIHSLIAALPEGYDTIIGERGGTLSGGQRQCVAIARALIKDAPIVILDEPTAGLDSRSAALVLNGLQRLIERRTVIIISHQVQALRNMDRVVVLDGGRLIAEGTPASLLAEGSLSRRLHLLQTGGVLS